MSQSRKNDNQPPKIGSKRKAPKRLQISEPQAKKRKTSEEPTVFASAQHHQNTVDLTYQFPENTASTSTSNVALAGLSQWDMTDVDQRIIALKHVKEYRKDKEDIFPKVVGKQTVEALKATIKNKTPEFILYLKNLKEKEPMGFALFIYFYTSIHASNKTNTLEVAVELSGEGRNVNLQNHLKVFSGVSYTILTSSKIIKTAIEAAFPEAKLEHWGGKPASTYKQKPKPTTEQHESPKIHIFEMAEHISKKIKRKEKSTTETTKLSEYLSTVTEQSSKQPNKQSIGEQTQHSKRKTSGKTSFYSFTTDKYQSKIASVQTPFSPSNWNMKDPGVRKEIFVKLNHIKHIPLFLKSPGPYSEALQKDNESIVAKFIVYLENLKKTSPEGFALFIYFYKSIHADRTNSKSEAMNLAGYTSPTTFNRYLNSFSGANYSFLESKKTKQLIEEKFPECKLEYWGRGLPIPAVISTASVEAITPIDSLTLLATPSTLGIFSHTANESMPWLLTETEQQMEAMETQQVEAAESLMPSFLAQTEQQANVIDTQQIETTAPAINNPEDQNNNFDFQNSEFFDSYNFSFSPKADEVDLFSAENNDDNSFKPDFGF